MLERVSRMTTYDFPRGNREPIDPLIKHPYADQSLILPLDRIEKRRRSIHEVTEAFQRLV